MSEEPSTRDLIATIIYLASVILILCAFGPFRWGLLMAGCVALVIGYVIAIYKFATMSAALFILSARFFWLFLTGKDFKMLIGCIIAAACVYLIFKFDPASSAPLNYRNDPLK